MNNTPYHLYCDKCPLWFTGSIPDASCPHCGRCALVAFHVTADGVQMPTPEETTTAPKASERQVGGTHYRDLAIQPSEFIYRNNLNWLAGSIVKYAARAGRKGGLEGMRQDIEKVKHYAELWLEWINQPEGEQK